MTKQHFIALADHIRTSNEIASFGGIPPIYPETAIQALAEFCQHQNPAFKRDRWLSYIAGECGKNGGKVKQTLNA